MPLSEKPFIVVFNFKKYVRESADMRTSDECVAELQRIVQKAIDKACVEAQFAKRKTLMARDFKEIDV